MTRARHPSPLAVIAGLAVPTLLVGINLERGLILPTLDCIGPRRWTAISSAIAVAVTIVCALLSWRALRARSPGRLPAPTTLVAGISALSGALFAFTFALQGAAALLLSGCQR